MKHCKWLVIILSLIFLSCATLSIEPLNITAEEVLDSDLLYSFPMTPWHVLGFSMCKGTAVSFILLITDMKIVRYCYLDQGRLVGFEVDIDVLTSTGEIVYTPQDIIPEEAEPMIKALNRINSGLEPYDAEELNAEEELDEV